MNKQEFEQALRTLEPDAIAAIQRALKEGGPSSLKAAELLLAYTQGKPSQDISGTIAHVGGANISITYVAAKDAPITIEHDATPAVPVRG